MSAFSSLCTPVGIMGPATVTPPKHPCILRLCTHVSFSQRHPAPDRTHTSASCVLQLCTLVSIMHLARSRNRQRPLGIPVLQCLLTR